MKNVTGVKCAKGTVLGWRSSGLNGKNQVKGWIDNRVGAGLHRDCDDRGARGMGGISCAGFSTHCARYRITGCVVRVGGTNGLAWKNIGGARCSR